MSAFNTAFDTSFGNPSNFAYNYQSELLREPNLLVPQERPTGNVRLNREGVIFLCRSQYDKVIGGNGGIETYTLNNFYPNLGYPGINNTIAEFDIAGTRNFQLSFPFTISIQFRVLVEDANQALFDSDQSDENNFSGYLISLRSLNDIRVRYGDNTGDTTTDRRSYNSTATISGDTDYSIVIYNVAYDTPPLLWINGVKDTMSFLSGTGGDMVYKTTNKASIVGSYQGSNIHGTCIVKSVAAYPGYIDGADLSKDPYQFLRPA